VAIKNGRNFGRKLNALSLDRLRFADAVGPDPCNSGSSRPRNELAEDHDANRRSPVLGGDTIDDD
jgi:hypothetical protein